MKTTLKQQALDIRSYQADGFERVCKVAPTLDGKWLYEKIRCDIMYANHSSWVYFIVVDNEIVKVGETGVPLGILSTGGQPRSNSDNRFGRYRGGDNTDAYIRQALWTEAVQGRVSLWAKKCPVVQNEVNLAGSKFKLKAAFHKELELKYLDHMASKSVWPRLNKMRK